jgi:peptide/nickel transport system substrate-binding protein
MRSPSRRTLLRGLVVQVAIGTLLVTACSATTSTPGPATASAVGQPQKGGTLNIGMGSEPVAFDPPNYKLTTDLIVTRLIFDGLVAFDNSLNIVPGLATKWLQVDATTWRFELRKGVKFADGSTFGPKDVKASLERAATKPRGLAFIGFIKQVDIVDESTVDVKTKTPFGPFLRHMATPVAAITSADYLAKSSDDTLQTVPLGSGPFKLSEYVPKQRAVLVRNDGYWGKTAYLDRVVFQLIPDEAARYAALQSGQLDVIESPPPHEAAKIAQSSSLTLVKSPASRDLRLGFNVQDKVLSNAKLREAITLAVDAKSIVEFVVEGLARYADNGWAPPEVLKTDPPLRMAYDKERAKKALVEAGYPNGLTLELATSQGRYLRDKEIAEAIQQQLKEVGITANIKVMEFGAYLDYLARHQAQMFILGWGNSTGDAAVASRQNWFSNSAFNYANYSAPRMDQLLDEAEQTTDQAKRQALYQEMQKMLFDGFALKPIYWKLNLFAAQKKVKNFVANPLELVDVSETWIDTR